jgi:hypothetical protein
MYTIYKCSLDFYVCKAAIGNYTLLKFITICKIGIKVSWLFARIGTFGS